MLSLVKSSINLLVVLVPMGDRPRAASRIKRGLRTLGSYFSPEDGDAFLITTLPHVIRRPGRYRLTSDLLMAEANGTAITIDANHVTIDFMGHVLRNTAGSATCAIGIGGADLKNVALKHGTVSGFRYGVFLCSGKRYRVETIRAEDNWHCGISVEGADCVIRDNAIINTGGSTACTEVCIALRAFGARQIVEGNVIRGLRRSEQNREWVGIHFDCAPDSRLENNTIAAAAHEPRTWGLWLNGGQWGPAGRTDVLVSGNVFVNLHTAGAFVDHARGTCADNLLINITDDFIVGGPEARLRNGGGNVRYLRVKLPDKKARLEAASRSDEAKLASGGAARI